MNLTEAIDAALENSPGIIGWTGNAAAELAAALGPYVAAQQAATLREAARELARLPYVRPDNPARGEYEALLAIRRGNTDGWLLSRADGIDKQASQ